MEQTEKQKYYQKLFIEKAKALHYKANYDYSKVKYFKANSPVEIVCSIHGSFFQRPSDHNSSRHPQNCPVCGGYQKSNIDEFIKKAKKIHGLKYDYSESVYVDCKTKMKIFCKEHKKIFLQNANNHLQGQGCPCGKTRRISRSNIKYDVEAFIEKAKKIHGDKFNYDNVIYKDVKSKVEIKCNKHNFIFIQIADNHLRSKICCPLCIDELKKRTKKKTTEEFIAEAKEIHGDMFSYEKTIYVDNNKKVKIYCNQHKGFFTQLARSHVNRKTLVGCPVCKNSKGELLIRKLLKEYNIKFEQQKQFPGCVLQKKLPYDFYLPEFNVLIEFHGKQHYEKIDFFYKKNDTFELRKKRDKIKKKFAEENGFIFLEIPYWVKREYIVDIIRGFCNNA